ncbi:MAG: WG repeat-containing protein [Mediterranea sp.]|nr:WG repeat-containing protein [Mediterranea sp.]
MRALTNALEVLALAMIVTACGTRAPHGSSGKYYRLHDSDNTSWGFNRRGGEVVIPFGKYSFLNEIDEQGMILAKQLDGGKCGFIDIHERVIIPFVYDDIGVFTSRPDLAPVIKDGKQGFVNRRGEEVIPLEYTAGSYTLHFRLPQGIILRKGDKSGVVDSLNRVVVPFEYDKVKISEHKDCFIAYKGKQWRTFDLYGTPLSPYSSAYIIMEGDGYLPTDSKDLPILISTEKEYPIEKGESAYVDKRQKIIVPFGTYDEATPFGLGRKAVVAKNGKYGIIDEHGRVVLPLEYDHIERPSYYRSTWANIFVATRNGMVLFFDEDASLLPISGIVAYKQSAGTELFVTDVHGKKGLVDYDGKRIIPCQYESLSEVYHGDYIARKNGRYGYVSRTNKKILPFRFERMYDLRGDIGLVDKKGKYGVSDVEGKIIVPCEYDGIGHRVYMDNSFSEMSEDEHDKCRFIAMKNGKIGTIDERNQVHIPFIYDGLSGWVEYGPDGHYVKKDGKYGIISDEGELTIPIAYDYISVPKYLELTADDEDTDTVERLPQKGVIVRDANNKYGCLSMDNKEILPCVFDMIINDIYDFDADNARWVVLRDSVWSYLSPNLETIADSVPHEEIMKQYEYHLTHPRSNEDRDFNMITVDNIKKYPLSSSDD